MASISSPLLTVASVAAELPHDPLFWTGELLKIVILYAVMYGSAQLVLRLGVRVNYTRKINHFALFFVPVLLWLILGYEHTDVTRVISSIVLALGIVPLIGPIRRRVPFFATLFVSLDRPEDQPNTMVWLVTQVLAGYLVILPVMLVLERMSVGDLIMVPILVNAIGDGLAEPVGVRFGRRQYTTRAIFSQRRYVRTLEGSACVFAAGVLVVLGHAAYFTTVQLVAALVAVPVVMTVAEARAPHTWDTPYLFGAGGATVIAVLVVL